MSVRFTTHTHTRLRFVFQTYYRQHVGVMKYLLRGEGAKRGGEGVRGEGEGGKVPYDLLEAYLDEIAAGPFATCQEKEKKETTR